MPDIREQLRGDPTLTPSEFGRLVDEHEEAAYIAGLDAERDPDLYGPDLYPGRLDSHQRELAADGIDAAGDLICEAVEQFVDRVTTWRSEATIWRSEATIFDASSIEADPMSAQRRGE